MPQTDSRTATHDANSQDADEPAPPDGFAQALRRHLESALGRPVRCIETHISWVLLDGEHAWKLKKPVRLGFLDFGSAEVRERFCREELRLNRRLAPDLYLDVVAIRGSREQPRIDGEGPPIDHAVLMREFPPGALLSERLAAGRLNGADLDRLAERIAAFHEAVPAAAPGAGFGSAAHVGAATARVLDSLAQRLDDPRVVRLRAWCETEAVRLRPVFDRRRAEGKVRECHGDLHLANAVALGEEVTAFDCIEFAPDLRWIDVQSEVAFLAMDLMAHARGDLAFRFLDAWLAHSGDHEGVPVLRYYLVYRALVRAMVAAIRAGQQVAGGAPTTAPTGASADAPTDSPTAAPDYLALADRLARLRDARLLITHGLSGSGKSHLAARLLERAGALRLRSDVERKRLAGLRPLARSGSGPGDGLYRAEDSVRTYARLLAQATIALDAGWPVIVDATFLRAPERDAFRAAARERGLPFTILHCRAEADLLRERVRARELRGGDPSEAGLAVLERQIAGHDPLRDDERPLAIEVDTGRPVDIDALAGDWARRAP
ncbi:bifunctional aminoglycoside phosphotransferase/ATP-binding protein [Zeimonas arvi]|uniref:Aminoglycoside phosphotransferase n=1 Tax=Zeimonas arvi TaxID=2498847 RepID=A0A5C8NSH9_9BURK|nr:bifunctional aminoglycoside phosphotransferase/ATP-binding protein [Zeimonas arvi]TXL64299.1 aminoglycoside phosphotransferase [Zeimonas arvi]